MPGGDSSGGDPRLIVEHLDAADRDARDAEVVWAYPPGKAPLGKREPVRVAGAAATLISAAALTLYGWEVTADQQTAIRELILLAIPIIAPMVAGFEVARSKVDSPATVERKLKETRRR